jgi:hypothetical protein
MTFVDDFLDPIETFLLEYRVPDRQSFVEDDDFRVQMCRDGESQP